MLRLKTQTTEKSKSFKEWQRQDLEQMFGLQRVPEGLPALNDWLAAQTPLSPEQQTELERLSRKTRLDVDNWNEEDLKMKVISRLMDMAGFDGADSRAFFNYNLKSKLGKTTLHGVVDMVVATGTQKPMQPFFYLHEYKPETKPDADPQGQLLAAMLSAQTLNAHVFPVYGCYIVGRNWFFVALDGRRFSISDAFVSSKTEDMLRIFQLLLHMKGVVEELKTLIGTAVLLVKKGKNRKND